MSSYHIPVLLNESVDGLNINPRGNYVDVTFGGGGHSREILGRLEDGRLIAFDQDPDATANIPDDPRLIFLRQNFSFLSNNLKYLGIDSVDGIIADLGVSSHQFDRPERGFSFRMKGDLDMRMNPDAAFSARELVTEYSEQELIRIFSAYGEIRNARTLGRCIIENRKRKEIISTEDLIEAVAGCTPRHGEYKYLAKVFQALRIEVNKELNGLEQLLIQSVDVIKEGGRLVILSYHSLEDRMVKNFIRYGDFSMEKESDRYGGRKLPFKAVNRKVILPGPGETDRNPRARSARLRIAERTGNK